MVGGAGVLSFATITIGAIGFIYGLIYFYCNYKIVYKLQRWKRRLFQMFLTLAPLYIVILFQDSIYNRTQHIIVSEKLILGIIILEVIVYVELIFSYRFEKKLQIADAVVMVWQKKLKYDIEKSIELLLALCFSQYLSNFILK